MYFDLLKQVSLKYNDRIKAACQPLFDCFNLNHFWYYKIRHDGKFGFFDNNVAWCEYYWGEKLYLTHPYLRHPQLLHEGVHVLKHDVDPGYKLFTPGFNSEFQIISKAFDGIEAFGFSSFSASDFQLSLFVNEMELLKVFIKKFREQNQIIFKCLEENLIDLAGLMGPMFQQKEQANHLTLSAKEIFLKKMGIELPTSFSFSEIEVVKRLIKGYSASQIASEISRSKRTVEHKIERLKEKMLAFSKSELIEKFRELEGLGYLTLE